MTFELDLDHSTRKSLDRTPITTQQQIAIKTTACQTMLSVIVLVSLATSPSTMYVYIHDYYTLSKLIILACDENSNVLFFQLQFGTYLPIFRLDALAG